MSPTIEEGKKANEGVAEPAKIKTETETLGVLMTEVREATEKDVNRLNDLYAEYLRRAGDESYGGRRRIQYSELIDAISEKLVELGHPINLLEEEEDPRKTTYNV